MLLTSDDRLDDSNPKRQTKYTKNSVKQHRHASNWRSTFIPKFGSIGTIHYIWVNFPRLVPQRRLAVTGFDRLIDWLIDWVILCRLIVYFLGKETRRKGCNSVEGFLSSISDKGNCNWTKNLYNNELIKLPMQQHRRPIAIALSVCCLLRCVLWPNGAR